VAARSRTVAFSQQICFSPSLDRIEALPCDDLRDPAGSAEGMADAREQVGVLLDEKFRPEVAAVLARR